MYPIAPHRAQRMATGCLAAALILLPWGYRFTWDTTRALPLVLLTPALWFGRELVSRRLEWLVASRSRALFLAAVFVAAVLFAIVGSTHWAASLTMASTWCLLALAAILAAELIRENANASRVLLGSMVISVGVATAAHWLRWRAGGSSHYAFYVHPRLMGLHTLSGALAAVAMVLG